MNNRTHITNNCNNLIEVRNKFRSDVKKIVKTNIDNIEEFILDKFFRDHLNNTNKLWEIIKNFTMTLYCSLWKFKNNTNIEVSNKN
jgi:predicted PolB exonuclease-like 3'-5' exonuclease